MSMDVASVTLVPITADNYHAAMALSVRPEQAGFVAPVMASLADAYAYPDAEALLALDGEAAAGFVLIHPSLEDETRIVAIVRLLVDAGFQSKGLGRTTLKLALDWSRARWPGVVRFQLSVLPENAGAIRFYERAGFERTGEADEDGELIFRLAQVQDNVEGPSGL